jgi:aldehyde dehydrogenase (NAD+)
MEKEEIKSVLENQRKYFTTGGTRNIKFRLEILRKLRELILEFEDEIKNALWLDFHKPGFEAMATETRFVIKELNLVIRRLRRWSGDKTVWTPMVHFLASSYIRPQPYGQVLILSPWNFPFQLAFMPLIGAIAAGNCVVLKVSRQVPNLTATMDKILGHFRKELIIMMNGDHDVSEYLLSYKFDYIFFTGSTQTGKYVMQKAAENLTPVSLELGGKNPCVIASDARLDYAARRIAWGKFMNAGQTCICSDYVVIDRKVKERFLELLTAEIISFYRDDPEKSKDFARIISPEKVSRIMSLLVTGKIVAGGTGDPEKCYVAPTVVKDVSIDDPIMKEEVFGPVLPVLDFDNFEEVYRIIDLNPKPLATYIFTRSRKLAREFLSRTQSGSAGINDTVIQIASPYLPYGGVGRSGLGRYHGRKSFETFSNMRSVISKSNLLDLSLRYPPYSKLKEEVIRLMMR